MPDLSRTINQTERRPASIYHGGYGTPHNREAMGTLLADPDLALSLKYTAILAAFACLGFPLCLADFHALIPDDFWREHIHFGFTNYLGGWVPIGWGNGESFYSMQLRSAQQPACSHYLYFVAPRGLTSHLTVSAGSFDPPLNTSVSRFTLCHPFLRFEMHDETGIYLFT